MGWKVLDKIMAYFKDAHIPIALAVFAVTTLLHVHLHADLGPQYVNSIYAFYAFLGGHSWANREKPEDKEDQK